MMMMEPICEIGESDVSRLSRLSVSDCPDTPNTAISPSASPLKSVKSERKAVLVTGANSLLGQHVVKHLHLHAAHLFTHLHTYDAVKFRKRLSYGEVLKLRPFAGELGDEERLGPALANVTTVLHLWEQADFSLFPDDNLMDIVNRQGTATLVRMSEAAGVRHFILLSSIWTMTSTVWPSVMNPEISELPPPSELPFPAYAQSKLAAERTVFASESMNTLCVRLGPIYGEGDTESLIFTSIKAAAENNGRLPVVGDQGGFLQYTYAGNVAWGLLRGIAKMHGEVVKAEVVFLLDQTPIQPLYDTLRPFLAARGLQLEKKSTSFLLAYAPLRLLSLVGKWAGRERMIRVFGTSLPSPNFLYTHYYYWYFFSGLKARTYLDYRPLYDHAAAFVASRNYYRLCPLRPSTPLPRRAKAFVY